MVRIVFNRKGCGKMKKMVVLFFVFVFFSVAFKVSAQEVDKSPSSVPTEPAIAPLSLSALLSQTVIFLYEDRTPTNSVTPIAGRILGTAFIVGIPVPGEEEKSFSFIVTAKHVIDNQNKILGRYSKKNGSDPFYVQYDVEALRTGNDLWENAEDEGVDIVVFRTPFYEDTTMRMIPIDQIASKEVYKNENIGAADRVVIPCLLESYPGTTQNYPILRDGSIALITEEPIKFSWKFGKKTIETEQRIVFINSTVNEGFSGAPVFLWPGLRLTPKGNTIGGKAWLLGVVHGFQEINRNVIDAERENVVIKKPAYEPNNYVEVRRPARNVNTFSKENPATGMIFPSWQILEILKNDSVQKRVEELSDKIKKAKLKETKN
jgi:hypothetical protein